MTSLECRLFSQGVDFSNKLERGPLAEGLCVDQTSLLLLSSFPSPSQHGENGERQSNRGTKALIKKKKKGKKEREKKGVQYPWMQLVAGQVVRLPSDKPYVDLPHRSGPRVTRTSLLAHTLSWILRSPVTGNHLPRYGSRTIAETPFKNFLPPSRDLLSKMNLSTREHVRDYTFQGRIRSLKENLEVEETQAQTRGYTIQS